MPTNSAENLLNVEKYQQLSTLIWCEIATIVAIGQAIDNMITLERIADQKNIVKISLKAARHKLATLGHIHMEYDPITTDLQEAIVVEEELKEQEPKYNNFLKNKVIK